MRGSGRFRASACLGTGLLAISLLAGAATPDQGSAQAALSSGRALRQAGSYREAIAELKKGLNVAGLSPAARVAISWEIARSYIDDHKFNEAVAACRAVGKIAEGKGPSHACLGEAHMMRSRATEALPEAELALQDAPGLYEAKVVKGRALGQSGSVTEAERVLRDAINDSPNRVDAYCWLGELFVVQGKRDAAIEQLEKARTLEPKDASLAFSLGRLLAPAQAVRVLGSAVTLRPGFVAAWARLAEAWLAAGKLSEAESAAQQTLKLDDRQVDARAVLARLHFLAKRYDDALKEARAVLEAASSHASAKLTEADALAAKGEIDPAIDAYQSAHSLARTDPTVLVSAARACLGGGRETSAKSFADRAVETFPKWAPGWVVLGDILAKGRENAKAKQAYRTALGAEGPIDRQEVERRLAALK